MVFIIFFFGVVVEIYEKRIKIWEMMIYFLKYFWFRLFFIFLIVRSCLWVKYKNNGNRVFEFCLRVMGLNFVGDVDFILFVYNCDIMNILFFYYDNIF